LHLDGKAVALRVLDDNERAQLDPPPATLADRVLHALQGAAAPLTLRQLRDACRVRTESLCKALALLADAGRVSRAKGGVYALVSVSASRPPLQSSGNGNGNQLDIAW
jgi:hypothetical protein